MNSLGVNLFFALGVKLLMPYSLSNSRLPHILCVSLMGFVKYAVAGVLYKVSDIQDITPLKICNEEGATYVMIGTQHDAHKLFM